jgi:hypothetical protein
MAFQKVAEYHTSTGDVPCVVKVGYDAGVVTTTEADVDSADLVLINQDTSLVTGVALGTDVGEFSWGD